jgi:tRNA (cytidine/uridine-2'-O-)-methyltransferase
MIPHDLNVVLIEPEIPPNTGNIGRLCAATRTTLHLVEPLGFKLDDKSVQRAGLDYWPYLQKKVWPNFDTLRESHPSACFFYFTTKAKNSYTTARYQRGDFLVFGRETKGLPESLLHANRAHCVRLPHYHESVRSLNLATAVGIGLYEALRQIEALPES